MQPRIKPLVWESFDAWTHWAQLDRGSYYIEERNGKWRLGWRINNQSFPLMHTDDTLTTDLDDAKAAAQADYAANITAAIDPEWLEAVDALVEAAGKSRLAFSGYVSAHYAVDALDNSLSALAYFTKDADK